MKKATSLHLTTEGQHSSPCWGQEDSCCSPAGGMGHHGDREGAGLCSERF